MRLVVQRSNGVELFVDGKCHSQTGAGLLVLHGTRTGDTRTSCEYLAEKVVNLRIFEDAGHKMNLSALDVRGEIMIVSQFTLYADTRKGRRPAFTEAMEPVEAEQLYDYFVECVRRHGLVTQTGVFGAKMDIRFSNYGPVTIILDHDLS
ncbi:D-tyrosyl-tRNA(Tyr) deacylase [candidate division GN15 bacterium]|uniref:D-aminoacyl-tRNA deacylase n=1 Tax=candidate division GN15 bacterium TaxID=2072418 RepID=A0A855X3H1_9BACT|nr:MAG: D-tyrosyl-tRNA(Tyr) deacylase [candidate division GN15 bacterium]